MIASLPSPIIRDVNLDSGSRVQVDSLGVANMARPVPERVYMSLWHLALVGIGVYEYKTHKTRLAKGLAVGLILFHADAAISDAIDSPMCLSRYLLQKATGINFDPVLRTDGQHKQGRS